MSEKNLFELGDIIKWVNNSSLYAHQHKIIFRLETIVKNKLRVTHILKNDFGEYTLEGLLLYSQKDGQWGMSSCCKPVFKKWLYNNNVGGGFPALITSFRNF